MTLSQDRYCSVSAMLRKAALVTYDIVVEDTAVDKSEMIRAASAA